MPKRHIITDERDDIKPCFVCECKDIEVVGTATLKCFNCGARGPDWFCNLERSIADWNEIPRRKEKCDTCVHLEESKDVELAVYWCSRCIRDSGSEDNYEPLQRKKIMSKRDALKWIRVNMTTWPRHIITRYVYPSPEGWKWRYHHKPGKSEMYLYCTTSDETIKYNEVSF